MVGCTGCKLRMRRGSPTVGKTTADRTRGDVRVRRVQSAGKTHVPGGVGEPLTPRRVTRCARVVGRGRGVSIWTIGIPFSLYSYGVWETILVGYSVGLWGLSRQNPGLSRKLSPNCRSPLIHGKLW